MHGRQGFSLIEALVALSIAAVTLTAIFELQQQMALGQRRAVDVMALATAQENALALVQDLNPMAAPTGEIALQDGETVRWNAAPRSALVRNAGYPAGDGLFDVQLFTVTILIVRRDGRPAPPLIVERLGWRRIDAFEG